MDLFDELLAVGRALDDASVPWALVGGLALAVHGVPRATSDIDVLLLPGDIERALGAVRPLGFRFQAAPMRFPDGMAIRRVTKIVEGDALTLDLLLVEGALDEVFASRARHEVQGGSLPVVSREALVRMKTWAGRARDLADIERLTEDDR